MARSTAADGLRNQAEFYALTHFGGFWKWAEGHDWLRRLVNRGVINLAIYKTAPRPFPFSCLSPYTSWDSLTDHTYDGRHLPAAPNQNDGRPSPQDAAALFARGDEIILCPKSTVLFAYFAQWFTDGFLRSDRSGPHELRKNTSNHNIDLSQLYGLNKSITALLRSFQEGLLKSQMIKGEEYPPLLCTDGVKKPEFQDLPVAHFDERSLDEKNQLFAMGSDRANSQIGYIMMNTLFLREHNRLARELAREYPNWDDERLFQTARNILIVILLGIVVGEYINHIDPAHFNFYLDASAFPNERWYRQNWMTIEFNLLYRWHGLIPSTLVLGGVDRPVEETMFTTRLLTDSGLGPAMEDASRQRAGRIGLCNTASFLMPTEQANVSLCRELQLASYNDCREACHFPRVTNFDEITGDTAIQGRLKQLYPHVDRIDYYVGLFAEDTRPNGILPSLMGRLVAIDAFSQALTNPLLAPLVYNERTVSPLGMDVIKNTSALSDILKRNSPAGAPAYYVSMTREGWKHS